MQALRAHSRTSGLKEETVDVPELSPSDVLIKVISAGISPGILKMVQAGMCHLPTTVGHEVAGTIEAMGSDTSGSGLQIGDRVRLHPNLACRACPHCNSGQDRMCEKVALIGFSNFGHQSDLYDEYHHGGLAEYVRAPHFLIDKLPEDVSYEVGAKVHDIATASRALKLANLHKNSTIILTAPTGTMGTLTVRLAELYSIKRIILVGRSKKRLEAVQSLTPIETEIVALEPEDKDLTTHLKSLAPEGVDAIIDYFPSGDALMKILPALRTGGSLVHMGGNGSVLRVPLAYIMVNCWNITGGRANCREDVQECLEWLNSGRIHVEDLFTHRFSFADIERGLDVMVSRDEPVWLSIVNVS